MFCIPRYVRSIDNVTENHYYDYTRASSRATLILARNYREYRKYLGFAVYGSRRASVEARGVSTHCRGATGRFDMGRVQFVKLIPSFGPGLTEVDCQFECGIGT